MIDQVLDLLPETPSSIKKLRASILDLAIRGKLVPQDLKDEPASELLAKIKADTSTALSVRRSKSLPEIKPQETLFELPNGWEWVRLGEITHNFGQKKPTEKFTYIDVGSIDNLNGLISNETQVLESKNAPSRARKVVNQNCVIYSTVRPYLLNVAIVDRLFEYAPIASTAFAILNPYDNLKAKFLFYYLRSPSFVRYVENQMVGLAYPAINDKKLMLGLVPLPPLLEQKRIVEKVDSLMKLCDELEKQVQSMNATQNAFSSASLNQLGEAKSKNELIDSWKDLKPHFHIAVSKKEHVKNLKQLILQLAIQGKLVPQDTKDEPASELLRKIKSEKEKMIAAGKIRKEKPLPEIKPEEIPFDLPKGWEWVRLGEIANYGASERMSNSKDTDEATWVLDLEDIEKDTSKIINKVTAVARPFKSSKSVFKKGDVLFGKLRPYLNKILVAEESGICTTEIVPIRPHGNINPHYLKWILKSPWIMSFIEEITYGVKMPRLGTKDANLLLISIPPLPEQKCIVEKVDSLMKLCDELENKISESKNLSEQLMGAVLGEGFGY